MIYHRHKDFLLGVSPPNEASIEYIKKRLGKMGYSGETVKLIKKGEMVWALKKQITQ